MNIGKKNINDIRKYLTDTLQNPSYEYEVLFRNVYDPKNEITIMDKQKFQKVLNLFNINGYKSIVEQSLVIILDDKNNKKVSYRVYLDNKEDILEYCKTNKLNNIDDYIFEKKISKDSIYIDNYHIKINLKEEISDLDQTEKLFIINTINDSETIKYYRYRHRYTFMDNNKYFKVDCTTLKQNTNDKIISGKSLVESDLFSSGEIYEIEIELDNKKIKQDTIDTNTKMNSFIDTLMKEQFMLIGNIMKIICNTQIITTVEEINNIRHHYLNLLYKNESKSISYDDIKNQKNKYFGTVKAHTLAKENIIDMYGVPNILKGYTVTEKADGETSLMIIHNNQAYLMDKNFNLNKIKCKCNIDNCIVEGEFVKTNYNNEYKELYLIYDIHKYDNDNIYTKKLVNMDEMKGGKDIGTDKSLSNIIEEEERINNNGEQKGGVNEKSVKKTSKRGSVKKEVKLYNSNSRLEYMYKFVENLENSSGIDIRVKKHIYGKSTIFACVDNVLSNKFSFDYETDGIIFTPDSEINNFGDKSIIIYKWKPETENTIDFLVKFKGYQEDSSLNKFALCVGYNEMEYLDPLNIIYSNNRERFNKFERRYVSKIFDFGLFETNEFGKSITEDGEEIKNNMIVECLCVLNDNKTQRKWIPKRIRWDKTNLYLKNKDISGTANDYSVTVKTIMNLIYDPISEEMIRGNIDNIKINNEIEDSYYTGNMEILNEVNTFKQFQNTFGTRPMYDMFKKHKENGRILELACGRGGAMHKQIENFKYILGMDVSVDNIYSGKKVDSAYLRFVEQLIKNRQNRNQSVGKHISKMSENQILYVVADMGKNYKSIQKNSMIESELKNVIKDELMNNTNANVNDVNNDKKDKKIKIRTPNISNNYIIDVIFGNIPKKDLENNYRSLIPYNNVMNRNKFDVVSCQFAIHYMFKDEKTLTNFIENVANNIKEGGYLIGTTFNGLLVDKLLEKEDEVNGKVGDKIVWSLKKKYKKYDLKEPKNNYGLEIKNYFHSIGQEFLEYLVDFELLDSKMKEYGFKTLEKDDFKDFERHDKKYEDKEIENFYDFDKIYEYEKSKNKNNETLNLTEDLLKYSSLYRRFIYKKIK
jgi:hypothetical protein